MRSRSLGYATRSPQILEIEIQTLHPRILYPYFNFFSVNFSRTAVLVDGYAISSLNATITYPTKTMLAVMIAQMADIVVEPAISTQL